MRRLLSHLLVLLLCLPYLACAMPACGHDVAVTPSETTACVNHEKASEQLITDGDDVMFLSDCAEVDVALVQAEKYSSKLDVKKRFGIS